MNCVMFAWFISSFGDLNNIDLKQMLYKDREELEDDLLSFGFVSNNTETIQEPEKVQEYNDMVNAMQEWRNL